MCFFKKKKQRNNYSTKPFISYNKWYMRLDNILLDHLHELEADGMRIGYKVGVHELTILSRAPGFLIGYKGINTEKLKERLKNNGYPDITEVKYDILTNILSEEKWTEKEIQDEDMAILSAYSSEF